MTKHPLDHLVTLSTGEDRDEWLAARVPVITATQSSAIAGSNPYTRLIDVWNEKTDPDYNADHLRNVYLEERAALGTEREPEIIAWATEDDRTGGPRAPFPPNSRLVAHPDRPRLACTPARAQMVGKKLVLIECKTTQTRWDQKGIPQHILDQCYFQLYVTGAVTVWLAVEMYEWSGRGKNKVATLVETMLVPIQQDDRRLAFILEKIEEFRGWVRDGIAPESDVVLSSTPEIGFDDTPEEIQAKIDAAAEAAKIDAELTELDELEDRVAADLARIDEIKQRHKAIVSQYEGRRVHLIGERRIIKFTRYNQETRDVKKLPPETLREITSWTERTRMVVDRNPEYVPAPDDSADEAPQPAE